MPKCIFSKKDMDKIRIELVPAREMSMPKCDFLEKGMDKIGEIGI